MNILEQLVRVLTNASAEVKGVWWTCITWPRKSAKLSWSSLLLGANAIKATTPDPSDWLCSVSLPISVFFTHSLHDVLARTRDSSKTPRPYSLCPKYATQTANFWAQIILDPYRRPLTLTFLLVSIRGLLSKYVHKIQNLQTKTRLPINQYLFNFC